MPSILPLLAAAVVQVAPTPAPPDAEPARAGSDPFLPDTVLVAPGSPRIVLVSSVDGGVAALRLAVPLTEGPAEAGAGEIIQALALSRMQGLAGPVSARVGARRTPWGLVYTVEGASADLEYLAYLLRQAAAEPLEDPLDLERVRLALAEAVARTAETPGGRILEELRRGAAPHLTPLRGTAGTVAALDAARIRNVWRRSHRAEAMTLTIAAPVVPEVVLAAVRGLGGEGGGAPLDAPAPPEPSTDRPQSLRSWYGEAWSAGAPSDPRATVAALLLSETLEGATDGFEAGVQLQALQDRWLLMVAGAAYREDRSRMREAVSSALRRTRDALTATAVAQAVGRARRELLFGARTPAGLVERIGRDLEVTDAPRGSSDYLAALGSLGLDQMTAYLDRLLAEGSVTAEVRP